MEVLVFGELVRLALPTFNVPGELPPSEMGHFEMGVMLINQRLRKAMEDSLAAVRKSLSAAA